MEQKRAKEDSDALFLIQRSHFLVTSVLIWYISWHLHLNRFPLWMPHYLLPLNLLQSCLYICQGMKLCLNVLQLRDGLTTSPTYMHIITSHINKLGWLPLWIGWWHVMTIHNMSWHIMINDMVLSRGGGVSWTKCVTIYVQEFSEKGVLFYIRLWSEQIWEKGVFFTHFA